MTNQQKDQVWIRYDTRQSAHGPSFLSYEYKLVLLLVPVNKHEYCYSLSAWTEHLG